MSNRQVVDNKPSLRALSFVLRNRELWPAGFTWDYMNITTCAYSVAWRLWPEARNNVSRALGICDDRADLIFCNHRLMDQQLSGKGKVTPDQVADVIDKVVASTS